MKARYIVALFCFMFQISLAQVGIGTTSPSASLDIKSSSQTTPSNTDGLLIPKIDEFPASNPGANQDGMLVYASGNGTPSKGFYYWDNATTSWVFLIEKNYGDTNYLGTNPSGLELITEAGKFGYRLIGRDPFYYGNIGSQAVDLSWSQSPINGGALGDYSVATGFETRAIGLSSFAANNQTFATGYMSSAFGLFTNASAYISSAFGHFNENLGGSTTSWVDTDPLFQIGNGASDTSRSDALTILKNGTITAPSLDISEIIDNKALITKEFADANYSDVLVETDPKVGTLATGYVPRWNGTTLEDGAIFNSTTNVGIGTLNPQRLFDVRSGTGTATPNWISGTFGPANVGNRVVIGNLNGNATIGSHNSALNAWADLYLNSGGRVEIPYVLDASSAAGSGSLEIGNTLRIDDNEIITNSNSPLYFNNDNNGDVIIDNNSLMVDASTNKVGIGTGTPGAIITNSKLDVVGGHVAVSNNFGVLSFNSANNSYGAGFDTTTTDDLHLYAGGANRLIVTNTGNVSAPSFSMEGIYTTGNKALITKEYADANYIDATFSGDYNDLTNLPTLFDGDYNSLTSLPTLFDGDYNSLTSLPVLFSEDYNDLTNLPTLFSGDYNDLTNQPTITSPTGLEAINEGNGIGWRLIGRNPANHGNIGLNAVDLTTSPFSGSSGATGENSFAAGRQATASGQYSVAIGSTTSSGLQSTSIGIANNSTGSQSFSFGYFNWAQGNNSMALGDGSHALSDNSNAIGYYATANSFQCMALGSWNVRNTTLTNTYSTTTWVPTDPIFVVGNGIDINNQSDALTILKNGNVGIGTHTPGSIITNSKLDVIGGHVVVSNNYGMLSFNSAGSGIGAGFDTTPSDGLDLYAGGANRVNVLPNGDFQVDNTTFRVDATNNRVGIGTGTPSTMLHVFGANDASLVNGSGIMVVGDESSLNIVFDRNEIMARDNGAASPLYLQQNGGAVYVNGAVVHASDRRLKTNIVDLNYGLAEILKLQPKAYHWKNRPQNKKSLGLIAQDAQLVINEIVTEQDSESQTLGVNYTELIPVLINATKEQQNLIEQQQKEIESLKLKLQNFETLSSRIEKIEAQLTPTNQ